MHFFRRRIEVLLFYLRFRVIKVFSGASRATVRFYGRARDVHTSIRVCRRIPVPTYVPAASALGSPVFTSFHCDKNDNFTGDVCPARRRIQRILYSHSFLVIAFSEMDHQKHITQQAQQKYIAGIRIYYVRVGEARCRCGGMQRCGLLAFMSSQRALVRLRAGRPPLPEDLFIELGHRIAFRD
ncbi:hypothetical protein EVAR_53258_1 [Eumeta japonica]|uniref:Uncharacterized protein n=1 Tax=Eumeta variegata TaxID=151549 RepID=A0A4C1YH03_EUMVA|nr:hypothetical protein EVAR_53258_1 [Eumeta japonica]